MWVEKHRDVYRIRDRVAGELVTLAGGYPTKAAARDAMTHLKAQQLRGQELVPRGGKVAMSDWLDLWWPNYATGLKPSARQSSEGLVRRYIRPMLGHLALEDVDTLTIGRWVADLLAGRPAGRARKCRPLSPKTIHNAHGQLHTVLRDAVSARLIGANPCEHSRLPKVEREETRFLTEQEAERLLAAAPARWRPLILLLLFTGLRWGEAVGLRVGRLDILARRLTVVETMQELADTAEIVFVSPKSRKSRRSVGFPTRVAEALIELVAGLDRDALVFRAMKGGPVRYRQFRRRIWVPTLERAGLGRLRLHDLRHTHAAWLIAAGVPALAISRRLGHATISVTMDLYGHLMPEVDDAIVGILDGTLDKIETGSRRGAGEATAPDARRAQASETAGQGAFEVY